MYDFQLLDLQSTCQYAVSVQHWFFMIHTFPDPICAVHLETRFQFVASISDIPHHVNNTWQPLTAVACSNLVKCICVSLTSSLSAPSDYFVITLKTRAVVKKVYISQRHAWVLIGPSK